LKFGFHARIHVDMTIYPRKSWMWAEACALLDEAERKHRQFFTLVATPASQPTWEPPTDVFTDGVHLTVVVALPGARAEDVSVQVTSKGLQIETTVRPPAFGSGMHVVRLEIPYGRMRRIIELPPGRYVLEESRLDYGCLHLRLTREAT
jgi:HSP20 family molecular chaperone IbpA